MSSPTSIANRLECLLWDVDGTLTDTTALIVESLDHIYRKHYDRTLPDDDLRALIGTPLRSQIRVFGEPSEFGAEAQAVMDDFIAHYESHKSREHIHEPVVALLIEGKLRGLPTALVTSKNREELANTLPRLGIADHIDFAITADDVDLAKPDPEGLLIALKRFAIGADRAVYIGDTTHDMRAASNAGIAGIGVTWGAASRPLLLSERPYSVCDSVQQLRTLLFGATELDADALRPLGTLL